MTTGTPLRPNGIADGSAGPLSRTRLSQRRSPGQITVDGSEYPFNLPIVRDLDIEFVSPVTFFVGENGTGKSTVMEAIASVCRLPVSGGGRNELSGTHGPDKTSPLAKALRPSFRRRPPDAYFLRAEFQAHLASLLDERHEDPDFLESYGRTADARCIAVRTVRRFLRSCRTGSRPGSCSSTNRNRHSRRSVSWRYWRSCPCSLPLAIRSSSSPRIRRFC